MGFGLDLEALLAPVSPSVPPPPIWFSSQCHPNAFPPPSRFAFCIADSSRLLGGPRPGYGTLQRNTEPSCMVREELWVKGSLLASKQSILLSRPLHK